MQTCACGSFWRAQIGALLGHIAMLNGAHTGGALIKYIAKMKKTRKAKKKSTNAKKKFDLIFRKHNKASVW